MIWQVKALVIDWVVRAYAGCVWNEKLYWLSLAEEKSNG